VIVGRERTRGLLFVEAIDHASARRGSAGRSSGRTDLLCEVATNGPTSTTSRHRHAAFHLLFEK